MRENRSVSARLEPSADGLTLFGYAAVWDAPTEITEWGFRFTEVVRKGAFARTLASGSDVLCTFNHDVMNLLGRTASGTATFTEDATGLRFEVTLPDTETGRDVRELARRGDLAGASFVFRVPPGGDQWPGPNFRELVDVDLIEAGPVVTPAYADTSLGVRKAPNGPPSHPLRLKLELALKRHGNGPG